MTAVIAAPALVSVSPAPEAKSPGANWCYRVVCHRVRTIEETQALVGRTEIIDASFYDEPRFDRMNRGKHTSNGEVFDADNPARVSSSDYPDGTELLLRNPENGSTSHVRVNDFGPFYGGRLLDVTKRVAVDLGFQKRGVARIEITVLAAPLAEDTGYRLNRVMTPALGHVGVLNDRQAARLVERLVREQPAQRLAVLASATATAATPGPALEQSADSSADAGVLPDPGSNRPIPAILSGADMPAPDVEAPPAALLASLAPATAATIDATAAAVPTDAAVLPHAPLQLAEVSSPPPPVVPATEARPEPGPRMHVPSAASEVAEAAAEVPSDAPRPSAASETPETRAVEPAIVLAAAETHAPATMSEPAPQESSAPSSADDAAAPAYDIQRMQRVLSLTLGTLPTSVMASTLDSGSNMMMSALIAGLLSLALAMAWGVTRMWPRPARANAPLERATIAERNRTTIRTAVDAAPPAPSTAAALLASAPGLLSEPGSASATIPVHPAQTSVQPVGGATTTRSHPTGSSLIDADVTIEGTLSTKGRIAIAGIVLGDITAQALEILPGGRVEGKVAAETVTIGGTFSGSIAATHVSVGAHGDLTGDVVCHTIDAHIDARMEADFRRPR